MIAEFGLFLLGALGFITLYIVMAHLSARMGEGMGIPGYYLLYYVAILLQVLAISTGWLVHYAGENDLENTLFALFTAGNAVAIAASFKYWWWIKDELWINRNEGGKSDE